MSDGKTISLQEALRLAEDVRKDIEQRKRGAIKAEADYYQPFLDADNTILRESLSAIQHDIWAHWMRYVFKICETSEDGSVTIPTELVERWKRQVDTNYENLTEKEKDSDREQADKVLTLLIYVEDSNA